MCVIVEPNLKNIGSSEFTAYDKTNDFSTNALYLEQSTLRSTQPANSVKFGTKTAEIFMTKVENVYQLVRLLWLISLVDLMFSMISLILNPTTMVPRKISKISSTWKT